MCAVNLIESGTRNQNSGDSPAGNAEYPISVFSYYFPKYSSTMARSLNGVTTPFASS